MICLFSFAIEGFMGCWTVAGGKWSGIFEYAGILGRPGRLRTPINISTFLRDPRDPAAIHQGTKGAAVSLLKSTKPPRNEYTSNSKHCDKI